MPHKIIEYGSDKRYDIIESENWRCEIFESDEYPVSSDIKCCHKSQMKKYGESGGCALANSIAFVDGDEAFQPDSVNISHQFKVKCFNESGSKICFFPDDTKKYWENGDVNNLRSKRPAVL